MKMKMFSNAQNLYLQYFCYYCYLFKGETVNIEDVRTESYKLYFAHCIKLGE